MNRKSKTRSIWMSLLAVVLCISLTACLGQDFDAKRYVTGCLDAMTKAKFDDYTEMTAISKEEAQKQYDQRLDEELAAMTGTIAMDDKMKTSYRELFRDIYANFKYEVGEAVKNDDDTYTVPITTYKLAVFKGALNSMAEKVENYTKKLTKKEAQELAKDAQKANQLSVQFLYEIASENLAKKEYGDPQKIEVTVKRSNDDSKAYTISDSDYEKIFQACLDTDAVADTSTDTGADTNTDSAKK